MQPINPAHRFSSTHQPELIVFDMAGTTVFDGDAVNTCLRESFAAVEIAVTRDEVNAVMGIPKPVAIRQLLVEHQPLRVITDAEVAALFQDFTTRMSRHYQESPNVREMEGATDLFLLLRERGIKVVLDTGFSRDIVDILVRRLGWDAPDLVNATVSSDDAARGRPFPDQIFRAMELTGVKDVTRVAKVGDTPADLQQGTAAGCGWVIGVTNGSHSLDELMVHPHTHLVDSVTGVIVLFARETVGTGH